MLNRRLLRVKAMQSVYAYKQCKESNYELVIDQIRKQFQEELEYEGVMEKSRLEKEQEAVIKYFDHNFENATREPVGEEFDGRMLKIGNEALLQYQSLIVKDFENVKANMLRETEKLYNKYLKFLQYVIDFADIVQEQVEGKTTRVKDLTKEKALYDLIKGNAVVDVLRNNAELSSEIDAHKLKMADDLDQVTDWYFLFKKDIEFFEKFESEEASFERDKNVVKYIVRDFIFKNEAVMSFFEEKDMNWVENQKILRSMVLKTLKSIEEGSNEIEMLSLSRNWEEDKEFFEKLYNTTIRQEKDNEELIAHNSKKWSKDRIAKIDIIVINMAITEMVNFPNIPVKVSINEYLEVAKMYSTPKSAVYINGLLDAISVELQKEGKIRKSGRGLMDNK
ncbi:transcription antitermination factor NusB [Sediminitomix flava]|uniref:NusB antitermination factor n=1 Tax=Sediminitomix flava TaxID=379075 RepID=A0A315Z106_SEDFL|nr:transcription antitermination factor NusB [Sediminitomix flava]PWJ36104.1 NusB antitermination factor [Sediminitomix flava]